MGQSFSCIGAGHGCCPGLEIVQVKKEKGEGKEWVNRRLKVDPVEIALSQYVVRTT
jgi:hypothetical protein